MENSKSYCYAQTFALLRGKRKKKWRWLYGGKDLWRHLLQSAALVRVNFLVWLGCPKSWPLRFWKHPGVGPLTLPGFWHCLCSAFWSQCGVASLQEEGRQVSFCLWRTMWNLWDGEKGQYTSELTEKKWYFKIWKQSSRWNKQVYSNSTCCLLSLKFEASTLIPY